MDTNSKVKAATALSMAIQFVALNWDYSFFIDVSSRRASLFLVGLTGCDCEVLYNSLLRVFLRDFSWVEEYDEEYDFWSISIKYRF